MVRFKSSFLNLTLVTFGLRVLSFAYYRVFSSISGFYLDNNSISPVVATAIIAKCPMRQGLWLGVGGVKWPPFKNQNLSSWWLFSTYPIFSLFCFCFCFSLFLLLLGQLFFHISILCAVWFIRHYLFFDSVLGFTACVF